MACSDDIKNKWPTFDKLSNFTELQLRKVLRPHREKGFSSLNDDEIQLRSALDLELETLTKLELEAETGREIDFIQLACFNKLFFNSAAFAQYLCSYLFFGARFALSRITAKPPEPDSKPEFKDQWNVRPVALPYPPIPSKLDHADENFAEYRKVSSSETTKEAEEFLDGFVNFVKPRDFELWLKGLTPNTGNCVQLRREILDWVESRVTFYKGLEETHES